MQVKELKEILNGINDKTILKVLVNGQLIDIKRVSFAKDKSNQENHTIYTAIVIEEIPT
jgi:hypothetical protein